MKTRHLLVSLTLGLGLAVGLLPVLGGQAGPAGVALQRPALSKVKEPGRQPLLAQGPVVTVCAGLCDYTTIQGAVDNANPGDVIKVAADTYTDIHQQAGVTQLVYINKSVTIRGGYLASDFSDPPDPDSDRHRSTGCVQAQKARHGAVGRVF